MRKKKNLTPKQETEKKLAKLKKSYEAVNEELQISELPVNEQVHRLVDACDDLMNEICSMSDDIKINDLEKAKELTSIDKKTYLDFVNICVKKNNDKLKDKAIEKFTEDFNQRLLITNLRHAFLNSYMNGEDLKITDEDNEEYVPFNDYTSEEFNKIMQDSATKREYLNNTLWKKYKEIAKAAEYITNLELTYKDFKNLVDWQHYKDGGYPTPTTPSKIWSVFNKFNYAHKLLNKYNYVNTINELNHEFGLKTEDTEPHPVEHPWDNVEEKNNE